MMFIFISWHNRSKQVFCLIVFLRTRSGDVVRLVELLDEAKSRCVENITNRKIETGEEVGHMSILAGMSCIAAASLPMKNKAFALIDPPVFFVTISLQ